MRSTSNCKPCNKHWKEDGRKEREEREKFGKKVWGKIKGMRRNEKEKQGRNGERKAGNKLQKKEGEKHQIGREEVGRI